MVDYGTLVLTGSPAQVFTEPLTVAEVKQHLNLPVRSPVDSEEDIEIEGLISAARDEAEKAQNRDLVVKQWDLYFDSFWTTEIELRAPLSTVDLVQYKDSDGTTTALSEYTDYSADPVDGEQYIVDSSKQPGVIMPPYGCAWPSFTHWPSSAVLIRFTSGYTDTDVFWTDGMGKRILAGMKMLISEWFNNRLPRSYSVAALDPGAYDPIAVLLRSGALPRVR